MRMPPRGTLNTKVIYTARQKCRQNLGQNEHDFYLYGWSLIRADTLGSDSFARQRRSALLLIIRCVASSVHFSRITFEVSCCTYRPRHVRLRACALLFCDKLLAYVGFDLGSTFDYFSKMPFAGSIRSVLSMIFPSLLYHSSLVSYDDNMRTQLLEPDLKLKLKVSKTVCFQERGLRPQIQQAFQYLHVHEIDCGRNQQVIDRRRSIQSFERFLLLRCAANIQVLCEARICLASDLRAASKMLPPLLSSANTIVPHPISDKPTCRCAQI